MHNHSGTFSRWYVLSVSLLCAVYSHDKARRRPGSSRQTQLRQINQTLPINTHCPPTQHMQLIYSFSHTLHYKQAFTHSLTFIVCCR